MNFKIKIAVKFFILPLDLGLFNIYLIVILFVACYHLATAANCRLFCQHLSLRPFFVGSNCNQKLFLIELTHGY